MLSRPTPSYRRDTSDGDPFHFFLRLETTHLRPPKETTTLRNHQSKTIGANGSSVRSRLFCPSPMLITMVCLIQCQATAAAEAARSMARIPKGRSIFSFGHHFRLIRHPKRPFFLGGWFLLRCLQWLPALLMVMPFIRKHCKTLAKTLE